MTHEHEYVLGFVFQKHHELSLDWIFLVEKRRPDWQAGKLNGIGGRLEEDEDPLQAMRREFREETGTDIPDDRWRCFCCFDTLRPGVARLWLFTATIFCEEFSQPTTQEDEEIVRLSLKVFQDEPAENVLDSIRWMVPMAMAKSQVMAGVREA